MHDYTGTAYLLFPPTWHVTFYLSFQLFLWVDYTAFVFFPYGTQNEYANQGDANELSVSNNYLFCSQFCNQFILNRIYHDY